MERNRAAKEEIQQRISFAQSVIDKANADKEAMLRDMDYFRQIAILAESLAKEYFSQGESKKAIDDYEKALAIYRILDGDDCEKVKELIKLIKTIEQ